MYLISRLYVFLYLLSVVFSFPCGLCQCIGTMIGHSIEMYCLGGNIYPNFTKYIENTLKQRVFELHISDTNLSALEDNFCSWSELHVLNLSRNPLLSCESLHRAIHSCLSVRGQCKFINATPAKSTTTTTSEMHFVKPSTITIISLLLIIIMIMGGSLLFFRFYYKIRYTYNFTSL